MSADNGHPPLPPARGGAAELAAPSGAAPIPRTPPLTEGSTRGNWIRAAVRKFERPLTLYASHLFGGDLERARDAVQETFIRLCGQDESRVAPRLAEWLYTV